MKPLYLQLKDSIFEKILSGQIADGALLPTEKALAEEFRLSRVTVRKALEELKNDGIVKSVQGSGTVVSYLKRASTQGELDKIALVASTTDRFFGIFYENFNQIAEEEDAFVVFRLNKADDVLTNPEVTEKLIKNGIRNFVIWNCGSLSKTVLLDKLRGIGCNLVIFDQPAKSLIADTVCLDNADAIARLYEELRSQGAKRIGFIGAVKHDNSVLNHRAKCFEKICRKDEEVFSLATIDQQTPYYLSGLARNECKKYDALITANGQLARMFYLNLPELVKKKFLIGTVDLIEDIYQERIVFYQQPLGEMAKLSFECLKRQKSLGAKWKAKAYKVRGNILYGDKFHSK